MDPDQINDTETAKQAEAPEPIATTEAPASAEAGADPDGSAAALEAGAPAQIAPVLAAEAATVPEPQQPSEQE